jgi:hypothetical protein
MRMTVVGSNPRAGGAECIIFGHVGVENHRFMPVGPELQGKELSSRGGWEVRPMRPGADLSTARALVGAEAQTPDCRTTGRLVLVSHSWSGMLRIDNIGRKYTVDLYSEETRLVLLDLVNEIMVDVTRLAATENGVLVLPDMTPENIVAHVAADRAWFRFLERDGDYDPGPLRRAIERLRRQPDDKLKLRLVAALLPWLTAPRAAIVAPPPPPIEDAARLRDELRLLAAAVEGLALRGAAGA